MNHPEAASHNEGGATTTILSEAERQYTILNAQEHTIKLLGMLHNKPERGKLVVLEGSIKCFKLFPVW